VADPWRSGEHALGAGERTRPDAVTIRVVAVVAGTNGSYTATYHDTRDRRLTRANISLRRRLENGIGLWEAEIAGHVVSARGGPVDLPDEIARVLVAPLHGETVQPVARMRTADDVALLEGQHVVRTYEDEQEALHDSLAADRAPKKREPAIEHVRAYLSAQLESIERTDPCLRVSDDVEAVHDLRVAMRRARTALRLTRDLFDREWVDRLRGELRWAAGELGPARDLDVLLDGLRRDREELGLDAEPIVKKLERERRAARRRVAATLDSERYLSLLDELRVAVDHPPVHELDLSLERVADKAFRRLRRSVAALGPNPSDDAVHRLRIDGKRARYAAELARPVAPKRSDRFVKAAKKFQDVVGAHQDAVVAERRIRVFAESPEAAFGAGRLVERQRRRRTDAREALPRVWRRLERRGRKAWG
jgi:CHAD domain-containing protein